LEWLSRSQSLHPQLDQLTSELQSKPSVQQALVVIPGAAFEYVRMLCDPTADLFDGVQVTLLPYRAQQLLIGALYMLSRQPSV
jgi:hypothetical protein